MFRIESLLSARLFLQPRRSGNRLYFLSNLSGRLSLYAIDVTGSIPEPLLPPEIALQNPHLINGYPYLLLPALDRILVMIDRDGDENYQPMLIPTAGGYPEPAFGDRFTGCRVHLTDFDDAANLVYLTVESPESQELETYQGNLATGELNLIYRSPYGAFIQGYSADHRHAILAEGYTVGDVVLYLWDAATRQRQTVYGTPLPERQPNVPVPLSGIASAAFTPDEDGILLVSALFTDRFSPGLIRLKQPGTVHPVAVQGLVHTGEGELESLAHLAEDRYILTYNIDGVSWLYETQYNPQHLDLTVLNVLVGQGALANGYLESFTYDREGDRFALAFSTATSPTQLYTIEGKGREIITQHTRERLLGLDTSLLAAGEDASFTSFDGLRVSARLYLPSEKLSYPSPYPLVYYVHGGPQGQERPDFAWFSMPLIQYLTLNGFAVFVPNVRGSTGYGLSYTKQVDRDWGGQDRLDHVEAMRILSQDPRMDTRRAGVVGRSYGGYMTLTLAARHPGLWKGAVDMFGPFDLISFSERIPESWKPYMRIAVGDPVEDADFLRERSPKTHIDDITAPLLVIQGKNDPRVVEQESHDLVEYLRATGKQVEYLMFENEGHDILKFENRVRGYTAITDFFRRTLGGPGAEAA